MTKVYFNRHNYTLDVNYDDKEKFVEYLRYLRTTNETLQPRALTINIYKYDDGSMAYCASYKSTWTGAKKWINGEVFLKNWKIY
jgi:hypothetical protein